MSRDMSELALILPALAKGSLPFRLAIPETFSSVFSPSLTTNFKTSLISIN
jgi:hypothetical protein